MKPLNKFDQKLEKLEAFVCIEAWIHSIATIQRRNEKKKDVKNWKRQKKTQLKLNVIDKRSLEINCLSFFFFLHISDFLCLSLFHLTLPATLYCIFVNNFCFCRLFIYAKNPYELNEEELFRLHSPFIWNAFFTTTRVFLKFTFSITRRASELQEESFFFFSSHIIAYRIWLFKERGKNEWKNPN